MDHYLAANVLDVQRLNTSIIEVIIIEVQVRVQVGIILRKLKQLIRKLHVKPFHRKLKFQAVDGVAGEELHDCKWRVGERQGTRVQGVYGFTDPFFFLSLEVMLVDVK